MSDVVRTVAHDIRPGAVTVKFWPTPFEYFLEPETYVEYQDGQAILWQLTAAGFEPSMQSFFTALSGITYPHNPSSPTVNVIMSDHAWDSQIQKVVIGTYHPPPTPKVPLHTLVLVPTNGSALHGSSILVASAAAIGGVTRVQFVVTGGSLSDHVVGTAVLFRYGWIARWETTTVPNGTYTLQSVATETGGATATSNPIDVTVDNAGTASNRYRPRNSLTRAPTPFCEIGVLTIADAAAAGVRSAQPPRPMVMS